MQTNLIINILRDLGDYVEDNHYYFAEDLRETAAKIREIAETYKNTFEEDIFKECL